MPGGMRIRGNGVKAETLKLDDADLADDLALDEDPGRLPLGTAFWVIAGISILLWVGIVTLVTALV